MSAKVLATGRMIPSRTNSPPADAFLDQIRAKPLYLKDK